LRSVTDRLSLAYNPPGETLRRFRSSSAPVRALLGPIAGGRKTATAYDILLRAAGGGQRRWRWLVVAASQDGVDGAIAAWQSVVPPTIGAWDPRAATHRIACEIGHRQRDIELVFLSLDRPEHRRRWVSAEASGVWLVGARDLEEAALDRALATAGSWPLDEPARPLVIITSRMPRADHWLLRRPEITLFRQPGGRSPAAENLQHLPPGFYGRLAAGRPREWVAVHVDGEPAITADLAAAAAAARQTLAIQLAAPRDERDHSPAAELARRPDWSEIVAGWSDAEAVQRLHQWEFWARPEQLPPPGDWRIWLVLAGRGFGKTRVGAELVRAMAIAGRARRIALVGPTAADARDVMVEGESGIMAISPAHERPLYEPAKRRLIWPTGALAALYSADEPERLRGPQHDFAWCDELAAWRYPAAWDMLMFGLRLGADPRVVVTTTPKPIKLIRDLLAAPDVAVTRGSTYANRANLAPAFIAQVLTRYEGTRLGRQELEAEILEDTPGALWTHQMIETARATAAPELARIVVAIDPAATSGEEADETGLVVAGRDHAGHGWVLADLSGRYAPPEWARRAIAAYRDWRADRIVAEVNNGGDMVEATLRTLDPGIPYAAVRASRGKSARAEPVAALYEQGRIHHVGAFPQLEDQMCAFTADFDRARAGYSPDRVDALVWALSELLVAPMRGEGLYEFYRNRAQAA
jgi:phage terminase large subunit-like protein